MKKLNLALLFLLFTIFVNAQDFTLQGFKNTGTIVLYGIDFSQTKLFPAFEFDTDESMKNDHFPSILKSFMSDYRDNDFSDIAEDKIVETSTAPAYKAIESIDESKIRLNSSLKMKEMGLTEEKVKAIVKKYPKTGTAYYGIVFVVEYFNKTAEKAAIWPVIFNTKTGQVIFTDQYITEPGGFGFDNYWLNTIEQASLKLAEMLGLD